MAAYEYRVVPAPRRGVKVKSARTKEERFAAALEAALNEQGLEGWEFLRSDTLPSEERQGLTGRGTVYNTVLIYRRPLGGVAADEDLAPRRLLAAPAVAPAAAPVGGYGMEPVPPAAPAPAAPQSVAPQAVAPPAPAPLAASPPSASPVSGAAIAAAPELAPPQAAGLAASPGVAPATAPAAAPPAGPAIRLTGVHPHPPGAPVPPLGPPGPRRTGG